MKELKINETVKISGTDLLLESGDRIFYEGIPNNVKQFLKDHDGRDIEGVEDIIEKYSCNRKIEIFDDSLLIGGGTPFQINIEIGRFHTFRMFTSLDGKELKDLDKYYGIVTSVLGKDLRKLDSLFKKLKRGVIKLFSIKNTGDQEAWQFAVEVIGKWIQKCVFSKSAQEFSKLIPTEERWAKEIFSILPHSSSFSLDTVLEERQNILQNFCDPIENFVFNQTVSSKIEFKTQSVDLPEPAKSFVQFIKNLGFVLSKQNEDYVIYRKDDLKIEISTSLNSVSMDFPGKLHIYGGRNKQNFYPILKDFVDTYCKLEAIE